MRSEAGRLRAVVGTSLPLLEKGKGPYSEQYGMNRCWTCRKISFFNRIAAESCKESFCLDGSYQAQLLPLWDIETLNQGRSSPFPLVSLFHFWFSLSSFFPPWGFLLIPSVLLAGVAFSLTYLFPSIFTSPTPLLPSFKAWLMRLKPLSWKRAF